MSIGWWLRTNGGALYGTTPWVTAAATTDDQLEVRFTANDDAVHAIVLAGPRSTTDPPELVALPVDLHHGATVELLGHRGPLAWEPTAGGMQVTLPEAPTGSPAIALRMSPLAAVRPVPGLPPKNR